MHLDFRYTALVGVGLILSHNSAAKKPLQARPNIIYIMTDDHAYQAISAYGGSLKDIAPTPNIDRIARDGMRFDRCLVTNSISGPCRAVILNREIQPP